MAFLEAEKAAASGSATVTPPDPKAPANETTDPASASRLWLELAEALRSRGQLESRLNVAEEQLEKLRTKTKVDSKSIRALTGERNILATKVRDRDEELREKSKLVEVRKCYSYALLAMWASPTCSETGEGDGVGREDANGQHRTSRTSSSP